MITSIRKHIYKIKKLIREYYYLEDGFLIDRPYELLKLTNNPKVYISRKSLKHFVERRKSEMNLRYSVSVILLRLYVAIDRIQTTIHLHDSIDIQNDKTVYSKYFDDEYKSSLRVVVELIDNHWEIKSIHFKKNKKAT